MRAVALAILVVFAATPAVEAKKPSAAAAVKKAKAKRLCLKRAKTKAARRRCVAPQKKKRRPVVKQPVVAAPVVAATPAPVVSAPAPVVQDVPAQTSPAATTTAPAVSAPSAPACDPSPWIKATAEDAGGAFRLRLSRDCVPAGRVLLSFVNTDAQPHNLWVAGVTPVAAPRQVIADTEGSTTGAADLAAGTWRFYCSIPGHEAMTKTVSVTAP